MPLFNIPQFNDIISYEIIKLGHLFLFEDFVIAEYKEGVTFTFEGFQDGIKIIKDFYGKKNFGYISNRKNSYSINCTDGQSISDTFPNLISCATVTYTFQARSAVEIEKLFFNFNYKNFSNLEDAVIWSKTAIKINKLKTVNPI